MLHDSRGPLTRPPGFGRLLFSSKPGDKDNGKPFPRHLESSIADEVLLVLLVFSSVSFSWAWGVVSETRQARLAERGIVTVVLVAMTVPALVWRCSHVCRLDERSPRNPSCSHRFPTIPDARVEWLPLLLHLDFPLPRQNQRARVRAHVPLDCENPGPLFAWLLSLVLDRQQYYRLRTVPELCVCDAHVRLIC